MTLAQEINYDVKDMALAEQGKNNIEWAMKDMPVLERIKARFKKEQPFKGLRLTACVHVTKETAALCIAMKEGGADAVLAASLFHYKELEINQVKKYLREEGISVRL